MAREAYISVLEHADILDFRILPSRTQLTRIPNSVWGKGGGIRQFPRESVR